MDGDETPVNHSIKQAEQYSIKHWENPKIASYIVSILGLAKIITATTSATTTQNKVS